MSAAATAAIVPEGNASFYMSARTIGEWSLSLIVFLGAFVIVEPAPYELALVVLTVGWVIAGLRVDRYLLPLLLLLVTYVVGGLIGLTMVESFGDPIVYIGTTTLLAASAILFAAIIAVDPGRRFQVVINAYVIGAVAASVIGILGYFSGSEFFTLYGRARGTFQDPNVFGPFLVLPFSYLIYSIFTAEARRPLLNAACAFVMLIALFLTFSRAAWGMTAFVVPLVAVIAFVNHRNGTARARLILYATVGAVLGGVAIAVVVSLPGTSDLFAERAQLVQTYDAGAYGRFERQLQGFLLILERPFGVGPFQFAEIFGGDEHNMWLKGFTVYGWLGGFAYIALVVWTVVITIPLLFKRRPWQPIIICAFSAYLGHLIVHNVIDNDHWRHLFLIYGILWGGYVAERRCEKRPPAAIGTVPEAKIFRAAIPGAISS